MHKDTTSEPANWSVIQSQTKHEQTGTHTV